MSIAPAFAFNLPSGPRADLAPLHAAVSARRAGSPAVRPAAPGRLALALLLAAACVAPTPTLAQALTPAFTYQGELRSAGSPANASFDMQFRLYGAEAGGSQIGPAVTRLAVPVANGLFSVPLDFGAAQFAGDRQWLEIAIRPAGGGAYETLSPRTEVTAAPYAWSAAVALANSVTTTSLVDGAVQAADIAAGAVGTAQINPTQVQRRVSGTCSGTQGVQSVNADGTVVCGSFAGGAGTVTSIATGAGLTGGPITASGTISVAPGGIGTTEINAAQVQRRVSGSCAGTNYVQQVNADGTVGCGAAPPGGWSLSGNAGTNPFTNFIGTTDGQAFSVRVDNQRVARFEAIALTGPAGGHTANVLLGSRHNVITTGVRGATISGGGVQLGDSDPDYPEEFPNQVTDHYGTVGGGYANRAGDAAGTTRDSPFATVGGGLNNTASAQRSTVAGGQQNSATFSWSTVGGGYRNTASGSDSFVGGGYENTASASASTVGGGQNNTATSSRSTVSGGNGNTASGFQSTVGGGGFNTASGTSSTVSGGSGNCAGGDYSWAGGNRAKVRPGLDSGLPGDACNSVPGSGDSDGDEGSFVWADSQDADFVSTGDNQFLVRAGGGVGFNTTDPSTNFDVVGNRNGHAALIRNTDTVSPDGLAIRLAVATPTTANNFLSFQRGSGANSGSVEGNGSGGVVFNTSGGDYAEYLPLADGVAKAALPPGRVVGIRGGRVSLDTDGAEQLGVVSTNPAISGNDPGEAKRGSHALVAFLGQVDIAVAGPVNAGDFLIASGHADGRAIAVPPDQLSPELLGEVVGRAWTASTGAEGSVRALVGLNPADAAQSHALAHQNVEIEAQRHALAQQNVEIEAQRHALAQQNVEIEAQRVALARLTTENAAIHSELSALRTQSVARDAAIAELQRRLDQMARERGRP